MLNFFSLSSVPFTLLDHGRLFFCGSLSRVESIQMQTTFGWHQRKKEVFADVEEDTENIFQIKGLNYCMGFEKFCRQCRHAIVCSSEQASHSSRKGEKNNPTTSAFSQSNLHVSGSYLYFEILCIVWSMGVLFGPNNSNIDFRISEFWCAEQTAEQKPPAHSSTTTVLLHKLASFFYIARDQYASFIRHY